MKDIVNELRNIQQTHMGWDTKQVACLAFKDRHGLTDEAFSSVVEELHRRYPPPPIYLVLEAALKETLEDLENET